MDTTKQDVIRKYEDEARAKDNDAWLSKGNSVRVPENKAAHYFIDRKVAEALKLLDDGIGRSANVLEIGCSFGHMTSLLARHFDRLTAVDISPTSVDIARKRLRKYGVDNVTFIVGDAESLDNLPDAHYDVVFSFSTIRFCPRPGAALRAIHGKLKENGTAIIDFPNHLSPWHIFVKSLLRIRRHVHDNLFSGRQLKRLFTECGFEVERIEPFLFTTKRLPAILLPLFKAADGILERTPLVRRLGGILMVKARAR